MRRARPRSLRLRMPRRGLALDRMDTDLAQPAHSQHIHLQRAVDPVAIQRADQIIDPVDVDAIEANDDVARQQPGLRRRPILLNLHQQRTHLVLDAGQHRMPAWNRRALAGYADISAPDIAVPDDLRQYELR